MHSKFPPPSLADLDRSSAAAFMALARIIQVAPITLFLGAGVSESAGLPVWSELLRRICTVFFVHWEWQLNNAKRAKSLVPPRELSIAFWESFSWTPFAQQSADRFIQGSPLVAAQQIKNCVRDIDWRYLVNKSLYYGPGGIIRSPLFEALARLCAEPNAIQAVVNTNYDSLFARYLHENDVPFSVIWAAECKCRVGSLPLYHPHGYVKLDGGPVAPIVLAEEDYLLHSNQPYYWPNITQLSLLSRSTCIFLGHSLTDPNLRRLLRTSRGASGPTHFALLPRSETASLEDQMSLALFDRDLASLGVRAIRFPRRHTGGDRYSRLSELVDLLVQIRNDPNSAWS